ncbi:MULTISPECIES: sulfur carrier protein ThiS [unclassified Neisseria]|uniref:sulfur carrier protein ThiS n=1 Tax=unclassified Neisseria TaxID=2623750 RepID=UPI002665062A|nr:MULTISPECIES: sulfur carrier protein ThiS [unclassified Neisseria]MDO1510710.1 sulfur carrier protein ThiS [Neisseria sp. MVDL19-042950]MDO1517000.1 sulfur carrier protein ThiS [Neisseria sp. MVDL18-041461]MDO1564362.1 sulfur carrier protein ThiS [Neisseria sp. MVDL20-010259]
MNISLNGETVRLNGSTVADLIEQAQPPKPFAVAVNTAFVPKTRYAEITLNEGDKIDIVRPVVGG